MEAPPGGIHLGRPRGGEGGSQPKDDSLYISYLEQRGKTADKGEGVSFRSKIVDVLPGRPPHLYLNSSLGPMKFYEALRETGYNPQCGPLNHVQSPPHS